MAQRFEIDLQPLYRVAQYLTLAMLIIIPLQIIIFVVFPPPDTVIGFFELHHHNPFLGLLSLDFLYLINNAILAIIYLALFLLLIQEKPVPVLIAFVLGFIGLVCYFPSNPAFEMLTLSNQYFQALPEQQSSFLAAGEAVMSRYTGTSFNVYYVLSTICLLLFAYTIIKSTQFKKVVGYSGFVSGLFMIIPSSAGMIGMIFSLLSLIPWVIFITFLLLKFRELSNHSQKKSLFLVLGS